MASQCRKEFSKIFHLDKPEDEIKRIGHRINFSRLHKRDTVEMAVEELETLEVKIE